MWQGTAGSLSLYEVATNSQQETRVLKEMNSASNHRELGSEFFPCLSPDENPTLVTP